MIFGVPLEKLSPISLARWIATGCAALGIFLAGCASPSADRRSRTFDFPRDTFAFTNEVYRVYRADPVTGLQIHVPRDPPPRYALRCFILARAARQFLWHARFDPSLPRLAESEYRRRVQQILRRDARHSAEGEEPVVVPGFSDLQAFSLAMPELLKKTCGGPAGSYLQRGHWRMVFPFPGRSQERAAKRFAEEIRNKAYPILHLVRFPQLTINHAVLLYGVEEAGEETRFFAYDPNTPSIPLELRFDPRSRHFQMASSAFFVGGRVDVYEVYCGSWY